MLNDKFLLSNSPINYGCLGDIDSNLQDSIYVKKSETEFNINKNMYSNIFSCGNFPENQIIRHAQI